MIGEQLKVYHNHPENQVDVDVKSWSWQINGDIHEIYYIEKTSLAHVSLVIQNQKCTMVRQSPEPLVSHSAFKLHEETTMILETQFGQFNFQVKTNQLDLTSDSLHLSYSLSQPNQEPILNQLTILKTKEGMSL